MLEQLFQELNQVHFGGELPQPRLLWNARLSATAGRFCPGSRNLLRPRAAEIEVASYLRDIPDGMGHVRDTLLHEMIHYFLWHQKRPHGHTSEFRHLMKKMGAKRYNPVPRLRAVKYWYACPSCEHRIPARRKIGTSACAACCGKHNGGRYTEQFRLYRLEASTTPEPVASGKISYLAPGCANASPPPQEVGTSYLQPEEIIRRLEGLKQLLRKKVP